MAAKQKILTLEQIWAAQDIEERTVDVPAWGGAVRIRTFSKKQADEMRLAATVKDRLGRESVDNAKLEALFVCGALVEPTLTIEDYERMCEEKSAVAVGTVIRAILDASGLSDMAVAEADKRTRSEPDTTLRVFPGAGTEDDPRRTTPADVGA